MKKLPVLFFLWIGFHLTAHAQEFSGKAVYQSKTTVDFNFEGRNIPEARRQEILERMKQAMERTFELDFNRVASNYREQEKLEAPSAAGGGGFRMSFSGGQGEYYKNIQEGEFRNESEIFGKPFLIRDSLSSWNWKLGSETKQIGKYLCYKATAVIKADTAQFNRMRRMFRRGRDETEKDSVKKDSTEGNSLLSRIEPPKDREVIAWYTPEIPVSQGPGPYWGLPGLILEVNDGRTAILCSKLVLNPEEKVRIGPPDKGKEVTQEEFEAIMAEKMEEMSERFRGGNRRGGNRIIIRN